MPQPQPPPPSSSSPSLPLAVRTAAAWSGALLLTGAVAAGLVALCVWLSAAVVPVLLALLVSALVEPFSHWLQRRGLNAGWAAGTTCAVLVVVVGGAGWLLVTVVADTSGDIAAALAAAADKVTGDGPVAKAVQGAADGLSRLGRAVAQSVAKGVLSGLGLAAQLLAGAVLTLALVFFRLRDRDRALAALLALAPPGKRQLVLRLMERAYRALSGFMRGTTLIALVDGTFIGAGLALLGVPHALALGALVFFGAYVPYVGAFLTGLVAVLVAFADGGLDLALGALAVVFATQLIEGNVLQPLVQSRTVAMHPALVMLAVTAGASVGGLLGALLAVPLAATALGMIAELRAQRSGHTAGT